MNCKKKLKYLPFPIWSLCLYKNWVVLSGGGGGKTFGIKNKIILCKVNTMETIQECDTGQELAVSLSYLSIKDLILAATGKSIGVFKISSTQQIQEISKTLSENTKNINTLKSFNEETMLITGGDEGVIRIWKLESEKNIKKVLEIETGFEVSACDANSKYICASLKNKTCSIYSLETGLKLKSLQFCENISTPMIIKSCSLYNNQLLTLQTGIKSTSYLTKWSLDSEIVPIDSVAVSSGSAPYLKLSKSGKIAGVASSDGSVIVVSTDDLKILYQKTIFHMPATCLDFNLRENAMLVGAADYAYEYIKFTKGSWLSVALFGILISLISYFLL